MAYRVEQSYVDHVKGTSRVRVLPKVYKTWQGADKAAQRLNYVVAPDSRTRVCTSTAKVMPGGESFFGKPRTRIQISAVELERIRTARDAEWSRALGIPNTLTPDEAEKWLDADRVTRARNVAEARPRRGPAWH